MIAQAAGWRWGYRADEIVLQRQDSVIRYRERVRPLGPLEQLIELALREAGDSVAEVGPAAPIVTAEGEYGVQVSVNGRLNTHELAFIFLDDAYARFSAVGGIDDHVRETVTRLAKSDQHQLGIRRRNFIHEPPRGWAERNVGRRLEYRSAHGTIAVWPALPCQGSSITAISSMIGHSSCGFSVDRCEGPVTVRAAGLEGAMWRLRGYYEDREPCYRELAVLTDERYIYALRLDPIAGQEQLARASFRRVLDSVVLLPNPQAEVRGLAKEVFSYWAQ